MADPKSNIQEVIDKLTRLKGHIDAEITRYTAAKENVEDNYRVADNKKEMNAARKEIQNQVARIDTLILDNPEIASLIGALGEGEVESLNTTIRAVLAKVEELKTLGIKDKNGKDVDFKTSTEGVVTEVDKIEKINEDVDYDKVGENITEIEGKIALEELYQKYAATQAALGTEFVDENYEKFNKDFVEKLNEYKSLEELKELSTAGLKEKVGGKHTLKRYKADVEKLLEVLKKAKGDSQVTIPGVNGGNPIAIKDLSIDELTKIKNDNYIKSAMDQLVSAAKVQDSDFEAKTAEMLDVLRDNKSMQLLFTEDRDALKAILDKKPVNVAEIDAILAEMSKPDGKNNKVFESMETYKSIGDIEVLKRELARLKELHGYIEAENAAKAVTYEAKEFTEIEIDGQNITLIPNKKYKKKFVEIEDSEIEAVMEATYKKLGDDKYDALAEKVENDAKATGNKLPGRIWSGLMSIITLGNYNPRQRAIEARVKGLLTEGIKNTRNSSIDKANAKQEIADENAEQATETREKMTDFDRSLRVTENDLAREKMRQEIIASRGAVTAEAAKGNLNLDQINDEAKKKLDDEGR